MIPRIDGASCPGERTDYQGDSADGIDALGAAEVPRAYEQRDACKAEDKPDLNAWAGPDAAGAQPVNDYHPERNCGHKQRGNAGWDARLGPGERSITAKQQQQAGDDRGAPLRGRWVFLAEMRAHRIETQADSEMPDSREHKRRNRFDANANEEIGGAPQDIDRGERNEDVGARSGGIARGRWGNCRNR